jgi:ATP-dependent Lhr-like helicase
LQHLVDGRRARDADELHDLLRLLGPLTVTELDARAEGDPVPWLDLLVKQRRAIEVSITGETRYAAAEDAARLRDALGVALPVGLPAAFTDPVDDPLRDLVARYARTHGPFLTAQVATYLGLRPDRVRPSLEALEQDGRIVRGEFRPDGVEREWCDDDVLRQLRRRSLAALRKEVEPVDGSALARFLPAWQSVGSKRHGVDGIVDVLGMLSGAAIVASVLETDVLPARITDYRPADLDALCMSGDVVWIGAGPLGSSDGRVRLVFRDQAPMLVPPPLELDTTPTHRALLDHLDTRGASFWPELVQAVASAGLQYDEADVLTALWDLVWAGHVTNDSLAPLRAMAGGRPARRPPTSPRGRPRPGRLARMGPPSAAGRWSLVAPLLAPAPSATETAHARAMQLLERYGVLTREAALAEGIEGGFAGVYPVLKALEDRGAVRRGYFVAGLGAAQFALPGAVDRLRSFRDQPEHSSNAVVLAATDPAQPFGASLPWPDHAEGGRPARMAGAHVVLINGELAVYIERGGHSLVTFGPDGWAPALRDLVDRGRYRSLEIRKVDGLPVRDDAVRAIADELRAAGFAEGYRGLVYRARR